MSPRGAKIKSWRLNPRGFVWDNFHAVPDIWQEEFLLALGNPALMRIALKACVGPGKTACLAWAVWYFLACYGEPGNHPKGFGLSITEENLSDNLWAELSKWQQLSPYLLETFQWTKSRVFCKSHPNTWFFSARTWSKKANAEELGKTLSGLHSKYILIVIDESGEIPLQILKSGDQALSSTDKVFAKMIQAGNPSSHSGILYAATTTLAHMWHTITITGDPDDPRRSPRIDIDNAREQIKTYGRDDPWVMYSILGLFPPSSINSLLSSDEVEQAMGKHLQDQLYNYQQKRLGVDVALEGDDRTVIFPRQGLAAFKPVEMRSAKPSDIAARIIQAKVNWKSEIEFIDNTGGFGSGVVDSMRIAGYEPMPIHFSGKAIDPRYYNKRTEMWFLMRDWIRAGGALPHNPQLKRELTCPTYTLKNGRTILEPKESIKRRLKFSPDCFVAGTMISTPLGDVRIEQIKEGDLVSTPHGSRAVIRTWKSETDSLTTLKTKCGKTLIGKGKHEIFTWNRGFVRLDALSLIDELEAKSFIRGLAWNILNLLYTQEKRFSFKQLAGTIHQGRICRKSFYTGSFGSTIMEKYREVWTSITRTLIGQTTGFQTLSYCLEATTPDFIAKRIMKTQTMLGEPGLDSREPLRQQSFGTQAQLVTLGTLSTVKTVGLIASHLIQSAWSATSRLKHFLREPFTALSRVCKKIIIKIDTKLRLVNVPYVAKSLFPINTLIKNVAPESVTTEWLERAAEKSVKVYNLTLESTNVYYANGILVSNCADALALTFSLPDMPKAPEIIWPGQKEGNYVSDFDPFRSL